MSDDRRRELERAASLDPTAEVAALRSRVRLGGDEAERVKLAAALGHAAARDAVSSPPHAHLAGEWHAATRVLLARALLTGAAPAPLLPPGASPAAQAPAVIDPPTSWSAFRELYRGLVSGADAADAVTHWLAANADVRAAAAPLREAEGAPTSVELATLSALSRVLDVLLSSDDGGLLALRRLLASVGLDAFVHPVFHPAFHELTAVVEADDPDEPPALLDVRWPGATFGDLVVLRSGVVVRAGRAWLEPGAAAAPLYFTHWRSARPTRDLSDDWEGEARWGAELRRDYVTADVVSFNVGGEGSLDEEDAEHPPEDLLTLEECRELLAHRSFVRGPRAAATDPRFPYPWSLSIKRGALPSGSRLAAEVARGGGWSPLR